MPIKVNLPNISLSVPVLPNIQFSNTNVDDNEFTFNQPLTLEQYSSQIIEKTTKRKLKMALKKLQSTTNTSGKVNSNSSTVTQPLIHVSSHETKKVSIPNNERTENLNKNDTVSCTFKNNLKDSSTKRIQSSSSKFESIKPFNVCFGNLPQVLESNNKKDLLNVCDKNKTECVEHQTLLADNSQKPFKMSKSSTWTCETCWVPNKNEIDVCVACQTQKTGTIKKVVEQSTWTCDACWVKNKSECFSCISCGTTKPGSAPENKPQPQFSFGLHNNTSLKSSGNQFKFGFDCSSTNQPSQHSFNFGIPSIKTSENGKSSEASNSDFKFDTVNTTAEQHLGVFKFGIDSATSQPIKATEVTSIMNIDHQPLSQFTSGNESKPDQPDFKFGLNTVINKPIAQFQFNLDKTKAKNFFQENVSTDSNVVTKSTNELKSLVNNTNEVTGKSVELQSKSSELKLGDTKQTDKLISQATFSFVEPNSSNSNSIIKDGDLFKSDKDKIETNTFNLGLSQNVPSTTGSTIQLVNGHSHSNEVPTENVKPGLIKTSQLFSFSSLVKQEQNLPDDQKKRKPLTFGTTVNDNKPFVSPILPTSNFSSTSTIFGSNNSVFGSGPTSSSTLTSSATPQFSFGLMAPPISNSFFTKTTTKENDKNPLTQTSSAFTSTTLTGFSFGTQSPPPVFSVSNAGGLIKPTQVKTKSQYT